MKPLEKYLAWLPEYLRIRATRLLEADVINFEFHEGWIELWISLNDTFDRCSADGERIYEKDLPEIHFFWKNFGHDGLVAWVANKRGIDPLPERQTEKYLEAKSQLKACEKT